MGVDRSLEQWQMGVKDLRRRMILAPTPRERERSAAGPRLDGSGHGEGAGVKDLIFEQTGGSPPAGVCGQVGLPPGWTWVQARVRAAARPG